MELGYCEQELTQLNESELDKRLASVAGEVYKQLNNISKELLSERGLYPGALYDKGDFIMKLKRIIGIAQNDILRAYENK